MIDMFARAGRAAVLQRKAYTEAFFDNDAAADGAIVVSSVGALTYLGLLLTNASFSAFNIGSLFRVVIASVTSWLILSLATWFTATRLFGAVGRPQTMIAMHGLAALPLLLEIFGSAVGAVALVWYLVVLVVATGEASELDMQKAAVSVLIGFAAAALVRALLGVPFAVFSALF